MKNISSKPVVKKEGGSATTSKSTVNFEEAKKNLDKMANTYANLE